MSAVVFLTSSTSSPLLRMERLTSHHGRCLLGTPMRIRVASTMSLCAIMAFCAVGCGSDSQALAVPQFTIEMPAEFQEGGATWTQTEVSPADYDCLMKFFQLNQELVGSPDVEGQPVLFTAGSRDRRFYWIHPGIDGSRWVCVKFVKGRYSATDGTGSPF